VVGAIHSNNTIVQDFSVLMSRIKNMLNSHSNFEVKFFKCKTNMIVHKLVRATILWASRCVFESIPLCTKNIVIKEMSLLLKKKIL
jgi:hypothetical protein